MTLHARVGAAQLQRERSRADIALRANLERNAAISEKVHERRIIYRGNAVTDPFDAEKLDGLSNLFGPADFARVNQAVEAQSRGLVIYRTQFVSGHTQLIAADTEGHDGFRC